MANTGTSSGLDGYLSAIENSGFGHALEGAWRGVAHGAEAAADFLVVNDWKTLTDPHASALDRTLAGISLASNFVGPEGRLIDRAATEIIKIVATDAGHDLLKGGVEKLTAALSPELRREFETHGAQALEALARARDLAVKALNAVNTGRGIFDGSTHLGQDAQHLGTSLEQLVHPGAGAPGFAGRLGAVARDGLAFGGDVANLAAIRSLHAPGHEHETPRPGTDGHLGGEAPNLDRETRALGVERPDAFIARGDGPISRERIDALIERQRSHPEKPVVVIDRGLSAEDAARLRGGGVRVAHTEAGAERMIRDGNTVTERGRREAGQLAAGYQQHSGVGSDTYDARRAEARMRSGPAEVGMRHAGEARAWDGKTHVGTISFVDEHVVQQYVGKNQWVTYNRDALQGPTPAEGSFAKIDAHGTVTPVSPQTLAPLSNAPTPPVHGRP